MVGSDTSSSSTARAYEWREQQGKAIWVPTESNASQRPGRDTVYTMEQVAEHNKPDDLWIVIHGKVYDVSKWAIHHPGGHLCLENVAGADASDAFENYHPAYVYDKKLPRFQVGVVGEYEDTEFVKEFRTIRQRLLAEGRYETQASFYFAQFCWIASLFALSVYLVVACEGFWTHVVAACVMAAFFQQLAFVGHDIGHNAISHVKSVDNVVGILMGNALGGVSIGWWKWSHNVHHVITNSIEHDPDIQHLPVFAVSKKIFRPFFSTFHKRQMVVDAIGRFMVSIQHFLYYPIMGLARFNLYIQSLILIFSNEQWSYKWMELPAMCLFWVWYGYLMSFLPTRGEALMFLLVSHFLAGVTLHVQITLSHFSMATYYGRNRFNTDSDNWFKMQLATSMDIASNVFNEWAHGGLQYQVEHHLFPRLPRQNLKYASKLVKEFAAKHNVPYHCKGYWAANKHVLQALAQAAHEVDEHTDVSKSMLWEGMNARG